MDLTSAERRTLKARAHALHPVVMIGEAGLTAAVLREVDTALRSREIIKIRVLGEDRAQRGVMMEEICRRLDATAVARIGKILVVYRPRPRDVEPTSKPGGRRKAKRRPKRGYQMS